MLVKCDRGEGIERAEKAVRHNRYLLESYIAKDPFFHITFSPHEVPDDAPEIAKEMALAGIKANVGPMAAVAGALSDVATGAARLAGSRFFIAENGGDVSANGSRGATIAVYAGNSPLSGKIAFKIKGEELPLGICTSSGKVGPSISFGDCHAATVVAETAALADAAATAVGNAVKEKDLEGTIQAALEAAEQIDGVRGCLVIAGGLVGRTGKLPQIVELSDSIDIAEWI